MSAKRKKKVKLTLHEMLVAELKAWGESRPYTPEYEAEVIMCICRMEIDQYIKSGPLPEPAHSERNGLTLAANLFVP